jgi:hypothetical protein
MHEGVAASERSDEREREEQVRLQASSDLDQILADAYDDMRAALPDMKFDRSARSLVLPGLRVVFETSAPLQLSEHHRSPAVLTGVVRRVPTSGRGDRGEVCARLECRMNADGRLRWTFGPPSVEADTRRPLDDRAVLEIVRAALESMSDEP